MGMLQSVSGCCDLRTYPIVAKKNLVVHVSTRASRCWGASFNVSTWLYADSDSHSTYRAFRTAVRTAHTWRVTAFCIFNWFLAYHVMLIPVLLLQMLSNFPRYHIVKNAVSQTHSKGATLLANGLWHRHIAEIAVVHMAACLQLIVGPRYSQPAKAAPPLSNIWVAYNAKDSRCIQNWLCWQWRSHAQKSLVAVAVNRRSLAGHRIWWAICLIDWSKSVISLITYPLQSFILPASHSFVSRHQHSFVCLDKLMSLHDAKCLNIGYVF